jgi:hypothetical protein
MAQVPCGLRPVRTRGLAREEDGSRWVGEGPGSTVTSHELFLRTQALFHRVWLCPTAQDEAGLRIPVCSGTFLLERFL